MSLTAGRAGLHVVQTSAAVTLVPSSKSPSVSGLPALELADAIAPDMVREEDCVSFLRHVAQRHPEGLFDLAFADPPYNLAKNYGGYDDERAEEKYLAWCNEWLAGMAQALKPGGSVMRRASRAWWRSPAWWRAR